MKCSPQNHGQIYEQKGVLPTEDWHLPSTSTKIKSWPLQVLTFNAPGKSSEWKSGMRHSVLWEKLAEQAFWQLDLFRRRFYEFQFLHLLIPSKTLTSLMVTSALAIKKNFTVKSQNRVTIVQTSREIIRWYYGYNFRLDFVLLNTWVFSVVSGLKVKVKSLSRVQLLGTTWTVAHQAPPSMGFSRQEYWSELPFPSPGDLPDPGIKPRSPALQADTLTSEPPGKFRCHHSSKQCVLEASNCNLTFYKTRQLATRLQVSLKCQVQTGFQAYSSKKKWDLFCLLKFQLSLLQLLLIGPVRTK